MTQYRDAYISSEQMIIVNKFQFVLDYLYPILQNAPRKHGVLRNRILDTLFEQVDLFITAGKSNQKSKLYLCDAGLAKLRFLLRFATSPKRKLLSRSQHATALIQIAECGGMLNEWIRKKK